MNSSRIRRGLERVGRGLAAGAARCGAARQALVGRFLERRLRSRVPDIRNSHVPVAINNRDRVTTLGRLVAWLEIAGFQDIIILDNDSSYPPLMEYYRDMPHRVVHLGRNAGHKALWLSGVFKSLRNGFYIYTDSDVIPTEACPFEIAPYLVDVLGRYPGKGKVGLGLRIDDLPECFAQRDEVIRWESRFWRKMVEPGVYDAPVDTTFALYRPRAGGVWDCAALRTGEPYAARHAPWYVDSANLSPEEQYYREHASGKFTWWAGRSRPGHATSLLQSVNRSPAGEGARTA